MEAVLEERAHNHFGSDSNLGITPRFDDIENPILRRMLENRGTYRETRFHNEHWSQYPDCVISYA